MYWIGGFLLLTLVIPNTTNFKERKAFSDKIRLEHAREHFRAEDLGDSLSIAAGPFYKRNALAKVFLGQKYRELWGLPVKVKVLDYEKAKGGLEGEDMGGGQQTISIDLEDPEGREWSLRSVNKDQKSVLPGFLRPTFLRYLFRDQTAALNPYGALVLPTLSQAIGIHYLSPELVFVPYNEDYGKYNARMAGRLAWLEENLNSSWKESSRFDNPEDIVNTEEMREMQEERAIPIDTSLYLKSRLFDLLISDWDRHEGQWEWALYEEGEEKYFEPIPKDRDGAFYVFDEGLFSQAFLLFNDKFQSFRPRFKNVAGLTRQSKALDEQILATVPEEQFVKTAREIQESLNDRSIEQAFQNYPPPVYEKVGERHQQILKSRLRKLPQAAAAFYKALHNG